MSPSSEKWLIKSTEYLGHLPTQQFYISREWNEPTARAPRFVGGGQLRQKNGKHLRDHGALPRHRGRGACPTLIPTLVVKRRTAVRQSQEDAAKTCHASWAAVLPWIRELRSSRQLSSEKIAEHLRCRQNLVWCAANERKVLE